MFPQPVPATPFFADHPVTASGVSAARSSPPSRPRQPPRDVAPGDEVLGHARATALREIEADRRGEEEIDGTMAQSRWRVSWCRGERGRESQGDRHRGIRHGPPHGGDAHVRRDGFTRSSAAGRTRRPRRSIQMDVPVNPVCRRPGRSCASRRSSAHPPCPAERARRERAIGGAREQRDRGRVEDAGRSSSPLFRYIRANLARSCAELNSRRAGHPPSLKAFSSCTSPGCADRAMDRLRRCDPRK